MHIDSVLHLSELPSECIRECSAPGSVVDAVAYWREELNFTVDRDNALEALKGYGAWDKEELNAKSDEELAEIVLWLACCDFNEWDGTEDSPCGSDIFVLE